MELLPYLERTTLHEDAAGLKLFLEILNGSDTENPEAELELKKLIQVNMLYLIKMGIQSGITIHPKN